MPPYQLIRSRRRTLALVVNDSAELVVRAPWRLAEGRIREFIRQKEDWIERQVARMKIRQREREEWRANIGRDPLRPSRLGRSEAEVVSAGARNDKGLSNPIGFDKPRSEYLKSRVEHFAKLLNVSYRGIKITNARRRWGSCSARDSLCFSRRLLLAPAEAIDYVVVHELAHIKKKDHSRAFWAVVAGVLPDYKRRQAWLRNEGFKLTG